MGIISRFQEVFKRVEPSIRGRLPFIHLFGTEKSYGAIEPDDFSRMVENYKSWAYACAWKNATSVAKCPLRLYKERTIDGEEQLDPVIDHPFMDLIKTVNPFSNKFELMTITQTFLELTGNAYWWLPKGQLGLPYMIWNIPAHWVRIVPSKSQYIEGYIVTVPGKGEKVPFDEDEVVHFKFPSPFNLFYGTGPLLAGAYGIDLNTEMKSWGINYFKNNAEPSGVLMTESSLSPEQYQRFRDMWNQKHRGNRNAGKMAILERGMKYERVGTTAKDTNIQVLSREVRDEILAMFGVPASKLGLVEDVNRANADANDYSYQKETILPRLTLIEEKINEKLLTKYDTDLCVKFDNPVPEDMEAKLKERQININSGYSSIDDERIKDGLEPYNLPETSAPLIPFSSVPAGEERPAMNNFGEPMDDEEDNEPEEKSAINKNYKDNKWKAFSRTTRTQEIVFVRALKRYFDDQYSIVKTNINKVKKVNKDLFSFVLFDLREQNEKLANTSRPSVRKAYITGLTFGMRDTNTNIDFNLFNPNIARAVDQRINFFVGRVNESTVELLRSEINDGIASGESIEKIASRIDTIYNRSRDFRSKRIAQTEVIGATNDGQVEAYRQAGVERKEWLTARDEKVRHSHQIDGQVVGINENFITNDGNGLLYPGDRSGDAPPSEVINCRCTVVPIVR